MSLNSPDTLTFLINAQTDPDLLDATLDGVMEQLLHAAFSSRKHIDEHVAHLAAVAVGIDISHSIPTRTKQHLQKSIYLHAASGPGVLHACLADMLYDRLWWYISRSDSPPYYMEEPEERPKKFYDQTSVYATILARAFATQPAFGRALWPVIEDVLVKGLFSSNSPEQEVFVALIALLLGASANIRVYLSQEGMMGRGMDYIWSSDEPNIPDDLWDWGNIVAALSLKPDSTPLMRLPDYTMRLPDYVLDSLKLCKKYFQQHTVGEGLESWDSGRLAEEAFPWFDLRSA